MAPKLKPETLEKRKAQILKAALTCFARKGYHQTTMDDIVEETGLSKGGVYWHFGSKKELFLAIFDSVIGDIETSATGAFSAASSVTERLDTLLETYSRMATIDEFKDIMPLLMDIWAHNWRDPEINQVAVDMYARYLTPLEALIKEGVDRGEFKPLDARTMAGMIFGMYDGLMVQYLVDPSLVDWNAVNQTMTQLLTAGLFIGESQSE